MWSVSAAAAKIRFRQAIWLMPTVFALHIVEEYGAGFPQWVAEVFHGDMTGRGFLVNNAVFMIILFGLTTWAAVRPKALPVFALVSWASGNLFWNFVFHFVTTFLFNRYSPGLVTALVLYVPVSLLVAAALRREQLLPVPAFAIAVSVGAMLMGGVIWGGLLHFAM